MNNWLASFSKNTLAVVAIAGGILFIVLSSPPHSVCDSQIEIIKESQKSFLYKEKPKSKVLNTPKYQVLRDRCKATNNPGGCYEFFQDIKLLLQDLASVTSDCGAAIGGVTEIKRALWETEELLIRIAWGDKAPTSYHDKFHWLDTADITLFCKLKARLSYMYGEPAWNQFFERMIKDLPGAKDLSREQIWPLTLFSENCARYP